MATRLVCRECSAGMFVDDVDSGGRFETTIYWNCLECCTSCIVQVRRTKKGNFIHESWHSENFGVKDYCISRFVDARR